MEPLIDYILEVNKETGAYISRLQCLKTLTFVLQTVSSHQNKWVAVEAAAQILSGVVYGKLMELNVICLFDGLVVLAHTDSNALKHPSHRELEAAIVRLSLREVTLSLGRGRKNRQALWFRAFENAFPQLRSRGTLKLTDHLYHREYYHTFHASYSYSQLNHCGSLRAYSFRIGYFQRS